MTRKVDETFGPYTIVRRLGEGAFGAVYEARKEPIHKRIALKLLHEDKAQNPTINARFVQEAQAAASLRHPHIVDVDDVGVIDSTPFIAMEFLEGETLSDWLEGRGPLAIEEILEALLPIFSAVAAVHARGIVHRDLKPDNIFLWRPVAGQNHPKLLDFGVAKVHGGHEGGGLTRSGALIGTPLYMSPEQWGGSKRAIAQSDQWALAVILFQCLTGKVPFEADELPALMMRISAHQPPSLRQLVPTIPPALECAVLRALEKDPQKRHASVSAFAKELLPFANTTTRSRWASEFGGTPTKSVEQYLRERWTTVTFRRLWLWGQFAECISKHMAEGIGLEESLLWFFTIDLPIFGVDRPYLVPQILNAELSCRIQLSRNEANQATRMAGVDVFLVSLPDSGIRELSLDLLMTIAEPFRSAIRLRYDKCKRDQKNQAG